VLQRAEGRAQRARAPGEPRRAGRTARADAITKGLRILPLTPGRWADLERLFGAKGACAGCWCMWMRLPAAEFRRRKGAGNRRALRALVARRPPGLIAYDADEPVAWVAVAPRDEYLRLANSRVLEPVPGNDVWAAPCFFVKPSHRGGGIGVQLLEAAATFARRGGARSVEGYPTTNRAERQSPAFVYSGFESTFKRAGFTEVARRSPTRPILRRELARRPPQGTRVAAGRARRAAGAGTRG
jgi:GNAT superfamily N-acetyltransferase